jgi:hypothetical protein
MSLVELEFNYYFFEFPSIQVAYNIIQIFI